ncbi:MAG: hypothetical protein KJ955_06315 [Nanoarchaeota archaeon]|nr:hypothetical protein [Nanoarchaeota archaeon]
MKLPKGTEPFVFSYAHYRVIEHEKLFLFFKEAEKAGLFVIDNFKAKSSKMSGAFVRDYPKGHWNAIMGGKQVLGGAEIKDGELIIDAKSKGGLKVLRSIIENIPDECIEFESEEFQDPMEMLK